MIRCKTISVVFMVLAAGAVPHINNAAAQTLEVKQYPPLTEHFDNGVIVSRDVVYSTVNGYRPLTMDVYTPPSSGAPKPAVMYVHGGGWSAGTARTTGTYEDFPGVLASLAARGYVVASINYRLSGEARFPAAIHDTKNAIRWLRSHAADFNMDATRMVIWGASAGGHIASLVGTSCGVAELEPPALRPYNTTAPAAETPPPSDCVQGVIDWYGITDLLNLSPDSHRAQNPAPVAQTLSTTIAPLAIGEVAFMGCAMTECPKEYVAAASPITWIDASDPPFLIQHGALDETVGVKQAEKFADALKAKGVPAQLVIYPTVGHRFANPTGNPRNDDINQTALKTAFEFIDRTIGPGKH